MSEPDEPSRRPADTVVLSGAASAWGAVVAEALAREGMTTVLVDPPGEGLDRVRDRVEEVGGSAVTVGSDLTDLSAVVALMDRLRPEHRTALRLVHVLPPPIPGAFSERVPAEIVAEAHRGYSTLVVLARGLLPSMTEADDGRLLVLGSAAARAPLRHAAVHSALAMALPPFLTALDREVAKQGVHVTYLEPAGFPSPPVANEVAEGRTGLHEAHRRFMVSEAAVARTFLRAWRHPSLRRVRFHAHERSPPSSSVLQEYGERALRSRDEPPSHSGGIPAFVPASALRGRTAVVTGASRGIGRRIALRLASHGMRVVLTARDAPALEEVAGEVRKAGGEAKVLVQDLLLPGAVDRLREFALETWEAPYLLVNNAGIGFFRRLARQDARQLTVQLGVDLIAVLAVTRALLPSMLATGRGHVLNVGSMAAEVPLPRLAPYSGIKGAVKGFTLSLGREVAPTGLVASVLEPVTVDTDFIATASEAGRRDLRESGLMRRVMIGPEEVGKIAERTVVRPKPVVVVPPRALALLWMYRGMRPLMDRALRLPATRGSGKKEG